MGFLPSRAKRFRPWPRNICETKNARLCFARRSRPQYPRTRARRRRRNGGACCGNCQRSAWTRGGRRGDVAETDQGAAFERTRGHSRGSALDSEVSWRTVFPFRKRSCDSTRSGARGNDRDGGAHGNDETREPPDRRRSASHRRGSFFQRRSGYQRDFVKFYSARTLTAKCRPAKRKWPRTSAKICRRSIANFTRQKMGCCCSSEISKRREC